MKSRILVAPLNWGLGHATRCIPIIEELKKRDFEPVIASDGMALQILKKEYPDLLFLELPSYQIEYAKKGQFFKWKLIKNSPKMMDAIYKERQLVKQWVREFDLSGIISDNRLGVFSKKVPSVFITHQLNVLTGNTSWLTSKMHQYIISKYDVCWVPDVSGKPNLTGRLGHLKYPHFKIQYLGPLSRFKKQNLTRKYDLMILLSGPEPQRSILEYKLNRELGQFKGKIVFIRGVVEPFQQVEEVGHVVYYNYMTQEQLGQTFNESDLVLCRSGYTTVMDLAKLEKKAFFIPTPGQSEQEYLAKKLKKEKQVPYARQEKFTFDMLDEVKDYKGLKSFEKALDWDELFFLFTREIISAK